MNKTKTGLGFFLIAGFSYADSMPLDYTKLDVSENCPVDLVEYEDGVVGIFETVKAVVLPEVTAIDRHACALSLPIAAVPGKKVVISDIATFAWAEVNEGGEAKLTQEVFTAGTRGEVLEDVLSEVMEDDLEIESPTVESGCGAAFNLRINFAVLARTNASVSNVEIELPKEATLVDCE